MKSLRSPKEMYIKRRDAYEKLLLKQTKAANLISNLRLLVFAVGAAGMIFLFRTGNYILCSALFIITAFLFGYLAVRHGQIIEHKKYSLSLYNINDTGLKRMEGEWKSFTDKGEDFSDESHLYSGDLDIFGEGSLFQKINMCSTYTGRRKLSELLTGPEKTIDTIKKRQQAVEELAASLKWSQRFIAEGKIASDKMHNPEELYTWAEQHNEFYSKSWVVVALRVFPVITISLVLLYFPASRVPFYIPVLAAALQLLMLRYKIKERSVVFNTTSKYKDNIKVYDRMLRQIEKKRFDAVYLNEIRKGLFNRDKKGASTQIKQLEKIVESISNRNNALFLIFNVLTLWDYQCLIALERWKEKSGSSLRKWMDILGQIEALSSLATVRSDCPDWTMPIFSQAEPVLESEDMGHPLLGKDRVTNNLKVDRLESILLITGSNMSGKSTLLRTAGINLVLAYSGAPVCAKAFLCQVMDICTCMRVSDNLQKNISSFYAELLRIKTIVRAAEENKQIFFLLDEIFKGTNSLDRHTGAKVLINKLNGLGAIGLVSTHDLELGDLEGESGGRIKNYHFREYYKDDKIYFDYKLRPGLSTTRNAMFLMKMAGIELDGQNP